MKDIHYSISLSKNAKPQALDVSSMFEFEWKLTYTFHQVIRKLKHVMPIARVAMILRLTAISSCKLKHGSAICMLSVTMS